MIYRHCFAHGLASSYGAWGVRSCVVMWTARIVGHTNNVFCVAMLPCGELMVSGSNDTMLKIWSTVAPFECVQTLNGAPFGHVLPWYRWHGVDVVWMDEGGKE